MKYTQRPQSHTTILSFKRLLSAESTWYTMLITLALRSSSTNRKSRVRRQRPRSFSLILQFILFFQLSTSPFSSRFWQGHIKESQLPPYILYTVSDKRTRKKRILRSAIGHPADIVKSRKLLAALLNSSRRLFCLTGNKNYRRTYFPIDV